MFAIDVTCGVVIEDEHEAGEAGQSCGAQMGQVRDAGHLNLDWNRYLPLDLFGAPAWPLRDDLNIVVCYIGIGLDRQVPKGNDSPRGHYHDTAQDQPTIFQREVDKCANHLLVPRSL